MSTDSELNKGRRWQSRAILLGLLLVLGGCQSMDTTGPAAESAVEPKDTKPVVSKRQGPARPCISMGRPAWAQRSGSLEGVGESPESQQDADARARADVIKQLEVSITGSDESVQQETSEVGFSYAITSTTIERVNLSVSGLEILRRHVDPCEKRYFALARLDRTQAIRAWQIDLSNLKSRADEIRKQVEVLQARGEVLQTILALSRLMEAEETGAQIQRRVVYLDPQAGSHEFSAAKVVQTRHQLETSINSIQIRKESGDDQQARPERRLDQPLVVRVVAAMQDREVPIPRLPMQFAFLQGRGNLDQAGSTDARGMAQAVVLSVEPAQEEAFIVARPLIDQIGHGLSQSLRQRLERQLDQQSARFRVTPPWGCGARNPLDDVLYKLTCELAKRVNTSVGAPTVVGDFVENRTKRRIALSERIERGIADGLVLTGTLQILEQSSPESGETPTSARVIVSGVYELDKDGSLWVSAKLVRASDRAMEATSETVIPQSALREKDLRELRTSGRPDAPEPIVQGPAPTQTYDDWVEQFWNVRNPSAAFTVELRPERTSYRVGEQATFLFRTDRDCYLSVVNIGTSGGWIMLLPNKWRPDPPLVRAADGWVKIPGSADGFDFTVGPPIGEERVKAICTTRPISLVQNIDLSGGLFQLSRGKESRFRDLSVTQAVVRDEDWSEARTRISTLDVNQTQTQGLRGLRTRGLAK